MIVFQTVLTISFLALGYFGNVGLGQEISATQPYQQSTPNSNRDSLEDLVEALQEQVVQLQAEVQQLKQKTAPIEYDEAASRFSINDVNVQIAAQLNSDGSPNGKGNLIIGNQAVHPTPQPGSHNLVMGQHQRFTGTGSIIFGNSNASYANQALVGGSDNVANARNTVILAGSENEANGTYGVVITGYNNKSNNNHALIANGTSNEADGFYSFVASGSGNKSEGTHSVILGGTENSTFSDASYTIIAGDRNHQTNASYKWIAPGVELDY